MFRKGQKVTGRTVQHDHSSGQMLIEVLIGLLIFSFISTAFMSGIYTSRTTTDVVNEQAAAESLTRTEMEFVKESPYWSLGFGYEIPGSPPPWDSGHTALDSPYDGYSVSVSGTPIDTSTHNPLPSGLDQGEQLIEVQVFRGTEHLMTTHTVKINR